MLLGLLAGGRVGGSPCQLPTGALPTHLPALPGKDLTAGLHDCLVKLPVVELAPLHLLYQRAPAPAVEQADGLPWRRMAKQL